MPAYSYESTFFQVYGRETVAIADLPFSGQSYTWDFRSQILESASLVPSPGEPAVAQQILAWLSVSVPNLTVNASSYNGASSPVKIGSYAWLNQGFTHSGGFLNFTNQYLGNVTTLSVNDNTASSGPIINYIVPLLNFSGAVSADGIIVSLSGGDVSGATMTVTWALKRNTSTVLTFPLLSYTGTD